MGIWHMFVLEVPFGAGGVNPPIAEKCEGGGCYFCVEKSNCGG